MKKAAPVAATPGAPVAAAAEAPTAASSAAPQAASVASSDRLKVSPFAKKIATEKNIPLNQLTGSGPGGRIRANDVNTYVPQVHTPTTTTPASSVAPPASLAAPAGMI